MMEATILKSVTGYSCPNCGAICSTSKAVGPGSSFISSTKPEFKMLPDPHYDWVETHQCLKCDTIYTLDNGT